jgi:hypothetical protein
MSGFQMLVNGVDVTPQAEWAVTWEERTDGVGQFTATIQDRTNDPNVEYGRKRDLLTAFWNGLQVFDGSITSSKLLLPPGRPWRRWQITGSDWNGIPNEHHLGVPVGSSWESDDGGQSFFTVDAADAAALNVETDAAIVSWLIASMARPDGSQFDFRTYVYNLIPTSVLVDALTGKSHLTNPRHTPYMQLLNELRALAGFPIYMWFDPTGAFHWTVFQDPGTALGSGLPTGMPQTPNQPLAPAAITDVNPDHITTIGCRNYELDYDGTYMPEAAYIVGATDYIYNNGNVIEGGTGWGSGVTAPFTQPPQSLRQIVVEAQASSTAERNAIGAAYAKYGQRARIKGSLMVGSLQEPVDGWRCGQLLSITDARLPVSLNGYYFPIQRVLGSLVAGQTYAKYTLEWGDGPVGGFSQKFRQTPTVIRTNYHTPAIRYRIYYDTPNLQPSTTYTLRAQAINRSNTPVRAANKQVIWSLAVYDQTNALVTGQGSISPTTGITNADGEAYTVLTTGSVQGLRYLVTAKT